MAEIAAAGPDFQGALHEVLAETPWIQDKFTAINGLLVAMVSTGGAEDPIHRRGLGFMGDSEFTDSRVALRFDTDERITPVTRSFNEHGRPWYGYGLQTMSHVTRELIGPVPNSRRAIIWTRSNEGLLLEEVASVVAKQAGTLTLTLSERYAQDLTRT